MEPADGLQATPAQLVFGRDMIYSLEYVAEWDILLKKKKITPEKTLGELISTTVSVKMF